MDEKKLLERHAYFYNEINKLSEIEMEREPDLGGIEISKTAIQMAYRDMGVLKKEIGFEGGIIDYLCYLSTEMFLKEWISDCKKMKTSPEESLKYSFENIRTKNVLRLIFKNPKYLFGSDYYTEVKKLGEIEDKKVFQMLMDYRFTLFQNSTS